MDWLALILFFAAWMGYAWFAGRGHEDGTTLLHRTNLYRRYWLMQATFRDPRMLDGLITQNLSATPAFFRPPPSSSLVVCWPLWGPLSK